MRACSGAPPASRYSSLVLADDDAADAEMDAEDASVAEMKQLRASPARSEAAADVLIGGGGGGRLEAVDLSGVSRADEAGSHSHAGAHEGSSKGAGGAESAGAAAVEVELAEQQFTVLLVLTGCTVAFSHGGNDVGNATGPLMLCLQHSSQQSAAVRTLESSPTRLAAVGGLCFVLGILMVGSRTIATVGTKIARLTQSTAFAVQGGATLAVLISSAAALPVSTSHCLVGALIGAGVASRYQLTSRHTPLDLGVLRKIVLGWVVTIPLAVALALLVYTPLRAGLSHSHPDDEAAANASSSHRP
jgi:hypothetical protein